MGQLSWVMWTGLKGYHSVLTGWRPRRETRQKGRTCDRGGGGGSDGATSQGMPAATRRGTRPNLPGSPAQGN